METLRKEFAETSTNDRIVNLERAVAYLQKDNDDMIGMLKSIMEMHRDIQENFLTVVMEVKRIDTEFKKWPYVVVA